MQIDDAKRRLYESKASALASISGSKMVIDDSLTDVYSWGWVFYFVPLDVITCRSHYLQVGYAVLKDTGDYAPLGTKGLFCALSLLNKSELYYIDDDSAGN